MIKTLVMPEASHIVILMHDFSTGGTERIAIRMADRWTQAGRRVTILCGTQDGAVRKLVSPLVQVVNVDPEIRRSPLSRLWLARAFAPMIRLLNPDVIFVPGNFHLTVAGVMARRLGPNRPPIICKLSNPLDDPAHWPWQRALISRVLGYFAQPVDGFVAMSHSLFLEAIRVLGPRTIRTIAEPILPDDATPPVGTPSAIPLILCIGRLTAQKNFTRAIQAFAHIAPRCNARMMILGEGEERAKLEREIARLDLADRIELPGHVPDVGAMLGRARLLLLSSDYEGYPAVAIEALAARRPLVTTRCSPAIEEIMRHPSFGRITSSDPQAIGEALLSMLDAPQPDEAALAPLLDEHRAGPVSANYLAFFDRALFDRAIRSVRTRTLASEPLVD